MPASTHHDLAASTYPMGITCDHCMWHMLVSAADLKAKDGDKRTLAEAGVRCAKCRSHKFTVTRFYSRSAARAFMRNI